MIRILVKGSSAIFKAGLERLLEGQPGFQLVADSSGEAAALEMESPVGVLVVEAETLADPSAREALDWASSGGPVVLLLRNPASEVVAEALRAGVKAVLSSDLPGPQLIAALEAAAAGLVVIEASDVEGLLRVPSGAEDNGFEALIEQPTPREIEVLRLVAAGLANKEIASRLEISEHTVKFHLASLMSKMGAASRTEAATLGIRYGLITL